MNSQKLTFEDYETRFRRGNAVCLALWKLACKNVSDSAEWARIIDKLERTATRLHHLVLEMQAAGFTKCPYEVPKCIGANDIVCWACPSAVPHWRAESKRLL